MRDGQYVDIRTVKFVMNRIWEALQDASVHAFLVTRPDAGGFSEAVNCFDDFGSKAVGRERAALAVPQEGFADVGFRLGQDRDGVPCHSEFRRGFASLQGTGFVVPARSAARRRLISSRQASEIVKSALASRLSINAMTSADRSSASRASASSKTLWTRAFIGKSLAPGSRRGPAVIGSP